MNEELNRKFLSRVRFKYKHALRSNNINQQILVDFRKDEKEFRKRKLTMEGCILYGAT